MVTKEAADRHERHQQELCDLISSSITDAMDKAMDRRIDPMIRSYISKAQADMQVYTDGVETMLQSSLDSIRAQIGLAAPEDFVHLHRVPASDTETGLDGHRDSMTT